MAEKNRFLIIGGTGFIGSHFINAAIKKDAHVISLSLHPPKKERLVKGVEYLHCDILNQSELKDS